MSVVRELLRRWTGRIALSTADQGLSSGANFVMNLLLARWLGARAYGAYAVGFSVYLFLLSVYNETVTEPMSVLAHAEYAERARGYYRVLLQIHVLASLVISGAVALSLPWFFMFDQELAWVMVGVAVSLPFSFLYWLCRRASYLRSDATGAAIGSAIYAVCLLLLLLVVGKTRLSSPLAYLIVGTAGLVASLFMHARASRLHGVTTDAAPAPALMDVVRRHSSYARWTLPASLATALGALSIPAVLAGAAGLIATGVLRAAQNLTVPIIQVQSAVTILMLPWMAQRYAQDGAPALRRTTVRLCALLLVLAAPYALVVVGFGRTLVELAYARQTYAQACDLLYYLLPAALLGAVSGPAMSALRAIPSPRDVLWSKAAAAVAMCLFGFPLILRWGLLGAVWTLVAVALAEAVTSGWLLAVALKRRAAP